MTNADLDQLVRQDRNCRILAAVALVAGSAVVGMTVTSFAMRLFGA